jgi:hypothetical protein
VLHVDNWPIPDFGTAAGTALHFDLTDMRPFLTLFAAGSLTRAAQAMNLELAPVSEARVRHGIRVG